MFLADQNFLVLSHKGGRHCAFPPCGPIELLVKFRGTNLVKCACAQAGKPVPLSYCSLMNYPGEGFLRMTGREQELLGKVQKILPVNAKCAV